MPRTPSPASVTLMARYRLVFVLPAATGGFAVFLSTHGFGQQCRLSHWHHEPSAAAAAVRANDLATRLGCNVYGVPAAITCEGVANG